MSQVTENPIVGEFTWLWNHEFFLETDKGNFIYSSSEYPGGDDTIQKTEYTYKQYLAKSGISFGRGKGKAYIAEYTNGAKFI